ncbi:mitochondrial 2-oxodicarboxylate carrier isoform X2 [Nannospalax galili]|uniref:mitochondrial 2-oxodicarboxylate carrier isoform X2 n=1 Tax=Nannospalax galili TaxID=1026970 RepID=UPI0004ED2CE2|nr:mitochondrial 2-oxodicarboxylate carrier isoform X2 [Nannospalax galili]
MHPLDVVKTRIFGFYKGILPPILAETPKRAVKFSTFEQYKKLLGHVSVSPALTYTIAGLGSGLTEAIVVNPFEVVKIGLQVNRNTFTEAACDYRNKTGTEQGMLTRMNVQHSGLRLVFLLSLLRLVALHGVQQPSTLAYARQIIKKEGLGLRGLNKGLTATLGRHGIFNMVYFGFYYNVKSIIPANKDPILEFWRKFGIGFVSGTIGSVINIPFDVAKSRIQGPQPVPGEIKYRTCFKTMATIYQEEGFLALYKGLLPKIMRLGPGGAVMLLAYEYTYAWLQANW